MRELLRSASKDVNRGWQATENGEVSKSRLDVALFNFKNGGLQTDGTYDFQPLRQAFAAVKRPPSLIILCEAKKWGRDGKKPFFAAAAALSEQLGRRYVGEPGSSDRGEFGPAVFYDPNHLEMRYWGDSSEPIDKRNLAHFELYGNGGKLLVLAQHWHPWSGNHRLEEEAKPLGPYGAREEQVLIAGDLNSQASGQHLPQSNWTDLSYLKRTEKGRQLDGMWVADTRAVDHLIGEWDEKEGRRVDGCGFSAVPELAFQTGTPAEEAFRPTVNVGIGGSELLIDWMLSNESLTPRYVEGSYGVYVPEGEPPSDHRVVVAAFDL